jgi:uncharacterized protein (DUF433 family)
MSTLADYITIDEEILAGLPVFTGTRVPLETLIDHLEEGISVEEFLEDFPTVSREQAISVIAMWSRFKIKHGLTQAFGEVEKMKRREVTARSFSDFLKEL